jgi:hypothetical protein
MVMDMVGMRRKGRKTTFWKAHARWLLFNWYVAIKYFEGCER